MEFIDVTDSCEDEDRRTVLARKAQTIVADKLIIYCHECEVYHAREGFTVASLKGSFDVNG